MASRRMFAISLTESDEFLELSHAAQCLYFHLSQNADDDGFIIGTKRIMRYSETNEDHLKELIKNNFILPIDNEFVVRHWFVNNNLQHYTKTNHPELTKLNNPKGTMKPYELLENAETQQNKRGNEFGTDWEQDGHTDKDRIGEDRTDKERSDKDRLDKTDCAEPTEIEEIVNSAWNKIISFYPSDKINNQDKLFLEKELISNHGEFSIDTYADRVVKAISNYADNLKQSNGTTFYCVLGNLFKPEKQRTKLQAELSRLPMDLVHVEHEEEIKSLEPKQEEENLLDCMEMADIDPIRFDFDHRNDDCKELYEEALRKCFVLYSKKNYLVEAYANVFYWFINGYEDGKRACNDLYFAIHNYQKYLYDENIICNTDFGYFIYHMADCYDCTCSYITDCDPLFQIGEN